MEQEELNRSTSTTAEMSAETFVINVSGVKFETTLTTLLSVPGSKLEALGKTGKNHESYRPSVRDYFFDRHAGAFSVVLQYHRCGALHFDAGLCGKLLQQELQFWGIDDSLVEQCCWDAYSRNLDSATDFEKLDKLFKSDTIPDETTLNKMPRWKRLARKAWLTIEEPSYSKMSKVAVIISTAFIIASIAVFMAESYSSFRVVDLPNGYAIPVSSAPSVASSGTKSCNDSNALLTDNASLPGWVAPEDYVPALHYADYTIYSFFLLEFIVRSALCPNKRKFFSSAANVIDMVCVIGQTAAIFDRFFAPGTAERIFVSELLFTTSRGLRIFRLLRVFKLLRHNAMLKVLMYTLLTSLKELGIVVVFLATFVILFASLAYYAETETFTSIPFACWWALVTMTTVGYGDVYPTTPGGYVVGTLCVLSGILSVAFTVPVVVSNFNVYYNHVRSRRSLRKKSVPSEESCSGFCCVIRKRKVLPDDEQKGSFSILQEASGSPCTVYGSEKNGQRGDAVAIQCDNASLAITADEPILGALGQLAFQSKDTRVNKLNCNATENKPDSNLHVRENGDIEACRQNSSYVHEEGMSVDNYL